MTRMSATEVSRGFSAALDRVSAGEEISIERGGRAVARLVAPEPQRSLSGPALIELFGGASRLDEAFADDVAALRNTQDPVTDPWAS